MLLCFALLALLCIALHCFALLCTVRAVTLVVSGRHVSDNSSPGRCKRSTPSFVALDSSATGFDISLAINTGLVARYGAPGDCHQDSQLEKAMYLEQGLLLPATYYPLPTTYFLLPAAYCPLPTTYCLPPTTYFIQSLEPSGKDFLTTPKSILKQMEAISTM